MKHRSHKQRQAVIDKLTEAARERFAHRKPGLYYVHLREVAEDRDNYYTAWLARLNGYTISPKGGATVCVAITLDGYTAVGVSLVHPGDHYVKDIGRTTAFVRAAKDYGWLKYGDSAPDYPKVEKVAQVHDEVIYSLDFGDAGLGKTVDLRAELAAAQFFGFPIYVVDGLVDAAEKIADRVIESVCRENLIEAVERFETTGGPADLAEAARAYVAARGGAA